MALADDLNTVISKECPDTSLSTLTRVTLALAMAQLARAYVTWRLCDAVKPDLDDPRWCLVSLAGFVTAAAGLWLILRPNQINVITLAVILLAILIYVATAQPGLLPKYLYWALFLPLFEELFFRGCQWGKIGKLFTGRWAPWLTYGARASMAPACSTLFGIY
ncbi:MAG: hypothetical protein HPY76_04925 [Anaerolineae bacterium]|nr:hypothetical protein [Anaerolineae bacterium]